MNIILGDCLPILKEWESEYFDLIYMDPPFNTGKIQSRQTLKMNSDENGDRAGFGSSRYSVVKLAEKHYNDMFEDYHGFLFPVLDECRRVLKPTGSILVHLDQNECHYVKIYLDELFGRENFRNEIIWAWDYGAKSKRYWPRKHNNIFWYSKTEDYYFDLNASDRLPYMAPGLVTPEKVEAGKIPTDTWFISIVGTNSKEKTGYPTQKPEKLLSRFVQTMSKPGDWLLDPFAGSGTLGAVADFRNVVLIDNNPEAIEIMRTRLNDTQSRSG